MNVEVALAEFIAAMGTHDPPWDELIEEEISELYDAYATKDPVEILKETLDVIYVLVGYLVDRGLSFDRAFEVLHKSNMAKFEGGGRYSDTGKLLKPDGWAPPDMAQFVGGAA